MRSIEDWIVKFEQSIKPYIRYFNQSYEDVQTLPHLWVSYTSQHEEKVRNLMSRLKAAQGNLTDGGHLLGPIRGFGPGEVEQYDLYLFFKMRVLQKDEWLDEDYLARHPDVGKLVKEGKHCDGMQHFVSKGFWEGRETCWNRNATREQGKWIGGLRHCLGKPVRLPGAGKASGEGEIEEKETKDEDEEKVEPEEG